MTLKDAKPRKHAPVPECWVRRRIKREGDVILQTPLD